MPDGALEHGSDVHPGYSGMRTPENAGQQPPRPMDDAGHRTWPRERGGGRHRPRTLRTTLTATHPDDPGRNPAWWHTRSSAEQYGSWSAEQRAGAAEAAAAVSPSRSAVGLVGIEDAGPPPHGRVGGRRMLPQLRYHGANLMPPWNSLCSGSGNAVDGRFRCRHLGSVAGRAVSRSAEARATDAGARPVRESA